MDPRRLVLPALLGAALLAPAGNSPANPVVRREPLIEGHDSQFAYVQTTATGATTLLLAQLTSVYPYPQARDIRLLATIDDTGGTIDVFGHLETSPDNALLLAYVFQSSPPESTDAFVDHNVSLYAMRTGIQLDLINEHRFSTLNKAAHSSVRLAEYLDQMMATSGLDAVNAARFDYRVEVAGTAIPRPTYRWNRDGTFSLSFNLAVHVIYPGGSPGPYVGMETFTRTYRFRDSSLEFVGWSRPAGPVAVRRDCFLLRAGPSGQAGPLTFEAQPIKFLQAGPGGNPAGGRDAKYVAGDIPRRTR